jgi:hypothetical protein
MAKRCPEEFNPWPPFVDIFASVILVMLLFLLITIVNIGYYAQFKYKISHTASVEVKVPVISDEQSKVTTTQPECKPVPKLTDPIEDQKAVSFHKIVKPSFENANDSFFEGGKSEGNAVSYATQKEQKEFTRQKLIKRDLSLTIEFQDKEIFLNSSIKRKIKLFIADINRRSKRTIYTLYVSDPKNVISSTIAKQISLGRVLNVKNIIKHSNVKNKQIKLNLQKEISSTNPYGNIIVKAHIP